MAFQAINSSEIAAGQPVTQSLWQKVKDSLDYLYSQIGAGGGGGGGGVGGSISNGSFEVDADADGIPDGWTRSLYPAGGGSLETTSPMHGAKAWKFIQQAGPGNGGGYLDMVDYSPCAPGMPIGWAWLHYATAAGMHNYVQVRWFDKAKVYLSTTDLYNSTANPTTVSEFIRGLIPPASAQYYKLRIIGGYTDTDIAGTAYFDGFREVSPVPYAQDHKTIAEAFLSNWGIWTEKGSVTVNLPALSSNCYVRLYFTGELKTLYPTTGVPSKIRFRMGGVTSGEFEVVNNTSYQKSLFSITLPRGVSGAQTLYMDLWVDNAADGCYGRKSDPIVAIEILIP